MIRYFLTSFFISAAAAIVFTPIVRRLALALGVVDKPGGRKVHRQNMPTLGGIAIAAAFFAGITVAFRAVPGAMGTFSLKFAGLCVGSAIILLLGVIDDIVPLKAKLKLVFQVIAASILIGCGFTVEEVTIPFYGKFSLGISGAVFSMLWIVGIVNAINLLDGLDGLAAGVSAIASFFIFLSAVEQHDYVVAFLAFALTGACAGFLPFNFYPARIFMGNPGSMFLGFILAAISIVSFQKSSTVITLFIPVIALGVPIIDTLLAIVRRLAKKKHIFQADKEHIHHKLLFREESQRRVVLSLYFLSVCFGMIALSFRGIKGLYAIIALGVVILVTYKWMKDSGFLDFR
ncbi:MAG: MraY family glycosyltransferase [Candidatus Omnitrophica bacterium]|nr:MraY family glycosyltransferase [Candidatus Omnitrophota bacterium]MDD5310158.1 MraY family glycosyltransferase [Candidatus Omnitrophota bacterium]MDD5546265.1 MraY family glycosyltransferase [Candidatus Omnitrophota bacterium]